MFLGVHVVLVGEAGSDWKYIIVVIDVLTCVGQCISLEQLQCSLKAKQGGFDLYTGESNYMEIVPCFQYEQRATNKWNKRGLDREHESRPYEIGHNTVFSIF